MGNSSVLQTFPVLDWNMDECPTPKSFYEECRTWMSHDHVEAIYHLMVGDFDRVDDSLSEVLKEWNLLCSAIYQDQENLLKDIGGTSVLPSDFLKNGNPLDRELAIMRIKWDFLEKIKVPEDSWGLVAVYVYILQLKLLIRKSSFIKEEGENRFNKTSTIRKEVA